MELMQPMKPMKPMAPMEKWWPENLGHPATTGAQNNMRYAVFPQARRLLVEQNGQLTTYNTADHQIGGAAQQSSHTQSLTFTSQHGPIDLETLEKLS